MPMPGELLALLDDIPVRAFCEVSALPERQRWMLVGMHSALN